MAPLLGRPGGAARHSGEPLLPHCSTHLGEKGRLFCPRRDSEALKVVTDEPHIREHPRRVLMEVQEGPRLPVEDAGLSFDEAVNATELGQQAADPLEVGGRRMSHARHGRRAHRAGRQGAREGDTKTPRRTVSSASQPAPPPCAYNGGPVDVS
jgi:hypothetical protein